MKKLVILSKLDENMSKPIPSTKSSQFTSKWIAVENGKIIAEGVDVLEVYTNAIILAKSKPQFKRIPI